MKVQQIAIFASGSGSNAVQLIAYFKNHPHIQIQLVLSNKKDAPVLEKAENLGVKTHYFDNDSFENGLQIVAFLKENAIDWVVLAGFLRKISSPFLDAFPNKIINIHPSLLPDFGGKGMYGKHVHAAVIAQKVPKSGITIHLVNEVFDEGEHLAQFSLDISPNETPEGLALRIQELEHTHFAPIIEQTLLQHA